MDRIKIFISFIILMFCMLILTACKTIDPYKSGRTVYSIVSVSAKEKDMPKVNEVIEDINRFIVEDESGAPVDILIDALIIHLNKKYDPSIVYLVADTIDIYWDDIEKAYLEGKLKEIDKNGKILDKLDYLKKFIKGISDQKKIAEKRKQ